MKTTGKGTMLAYLITKAHDQTVALVDMGDGLEWLSEAPTLAEKANRFVPLSKIPEDGGNPVAWAIAKLAEYMPGVTQVCGSNISPNAKNYSPVNVGGQDRPRKQDHKPERYAATREPRSLLLYIYRTGDEESSVPLGSKEQWEAFATWAQSQGGELQRLAVEGHTDAYRPHDAVQTLQKQLEQSTVPEKYQAIADVIRDTAKEKDVEGLLVSGDEEDIARYAAQQFVTVGGHVEGDEKHVGGHAIPVEKLEEGKGVPSADTDESRTARARNIAGCAYKVFGIPEKPLNFITDDSGKVSGSHGIKGATVVNGHLDTKPVGLNFKAAQGVTEGAHIAAHEVAHQVFSADAELGKRMMGLLSKVKAANGSAVSIYGAFEGAFENLMELGAAFVHSPDELKAYSPDMFYIAEEWARSMKESGSRK